MSGLRSASASLRAAVTALLAVVLVAAAAICACAPVAEAHEAPRHAAEEHGGHHGQIARTDPMPDDHCPQCPDREVLVAAAPSLPPAVLAAAAFGVTSEADLLVPPKVNAATPRAPPRSLGPPYSSPADRYDVLLT